MKNTPANTPTRTPFALVLTAGISFLPFLHLPAEDQPEPAKPSADTAELTRLLPKVYAGAKRDNLLSPDQIRHEHRESMIHPIPDYATRLRGYRHLDDPDTPRERPHRLWMFTVPEAHRADFAEYLVKLGIPREALTKKMPGDGSYNDNRRTWVNPEIPATKLNMRGSGIGKFPSDRSDPSYLFSAENLHESIDVRGLDSIGFRLENPNLNDRLMNLSYIPAVGEVIIRADAKPSY